MTWLIYVSSGFKGEAGEMGPFNIRQEDLVKGDDGEPGFPGAAGFDGRKGEPGKIAFPLVCNLFYCSVMIVYSEVLNPHLPGGLFRSR